MALTKVSTGVVDLSGSTGALEIAKGTWTERCAISSPTIGLLRSNTTTNKMEVYTNNSGTPGWQVLKEGGGILAPFSLEWLVVAGGGGGGASIASNGGGGGGGAGGLLQGTIAVLAAKVLTIQIGRGGAGGITGSGQSGTNGANSSLVVTGVINQTTIGGGGGGNGARYAYKDGFAGGSGGGSGWQSYAVAGGGAGTSGQGNDGSPTASGSASGTGGGGAGSAGFPNTGSGVGTGGPGGNGITSSISNSATLYAKGGQGGQGTPGQVGANGTGNGGGAPYAGGAAYSGGSGVIIIRFPKSILAPTVTSSTNLIVNNDSSDATYRVMTYTTSSTFATATATLTFS